MKNSLETLNYQPSQLSKTELANPAEKISRFFENNNLHEIKAAIWELYKGWVNGTVAYTEPQDHADMLFFYSQLIDFIDASYLMAQQNIK